MKVSKYHGCGNDFIIGTFEENVDYNALALNLCERHTGIGADGLIIAKKENDIVEMMFYNADGTRAPMCGNGLRCFCNYCLDNNLVSGKEFNIKTIPGIMRIQVLEENPYKFKVNLGHPRFDCNILDIDSLEPTYLNKEIIYNNKKIIVSAIYMATHHLVVRVDNLEETIKTNIGEFLCTYKDFKKGMNVNFVEVIDKDNIKLKTYERGVGWTLACGTGSCASFVILNQKGLVNDKIKIHLEKGTLDITKDNENNIIMIGIAQRIAKEIII